MQECAVRGHDFGGDGVQKDVARSVHTHALLQRAVIALGEGNSHLKETVCAPHRISVRVNGNELPEVVSKVRFLPRPLSDQTMTTLSAPMSTERPERKFSTRAPTHLVSSKKSFFLAYQRSKLANASFCAPIADRMRRWVAASRCGEKRCWGLPHALITQRGVRPRKRQF